MTQAIIFLVGIIAAASLVVGGVSALVVVVWAQNVASAVRLISNTYYLLIGLMPIILWFALVVMPTHGEYRAAYASPVRALLTTLQGAIVGSVLGAGPIFLTIVINVPAYLSDFALETFGPAVRDTILWSSLLLAVGAAVIPAIPLSFWAHYTRVGRDGN